MTDKAKYATLFPMRSRILLIQVLFTAAFIGLLATFDRVRVYEVNGNGAGETILTVPEAPQPAQKPLAAAAAAVPREIEPQHPLPNPPSEIKAIYATSWSAGNERTLARLEKLIRETELNAIVIDVKDYSGYVAYNTELPLPKQYRAVEARIPRLNALVKRLHDAGIYVIGRISVFQDQRLALARPELALQGVSAQAVWEDHKGLTWMDTASEEVWQYNAAIAREILERGFDEVNFDYIRFASDGNLRDIAYPVWDGVTPRTAVMESFFKYLRAELPNARLSADLFGLTTVNEDDLGIGQHLETAFPYFDAIAPMVYPSHYAPQFLAYANPAEHPYEIVKHSVESALARLRAWQASQNLESLNSTIEFPVSSIRSPKLRPWLQDFDLGATYDAAMVIRQVQAVLEASVSAPELYGGWMLWDPRNEYTREALAPE